MTDIIRANNLLPNWYPQWRDDIEELIVQAKQHAVMHVNADMLALYWHIGNKILEQQERQGWGKHVILQLSKDLTHRFPDDRGYSDRNLRNMRLFAKNYPEFPIWQVPLAILGKGEIWQAALAKLKPQKNAGHIDVPLGCISWYHHISLLSKVKDEAQRAYYIMETAKNGWSRDTMLTQIANGYIHAKGRAINNFEKTLPPPQSDLAKYMFKDPYNFSFLGTVALQNELDIEKSLTSRITEFLLEMGHGFAYVGRQYHITVDGDDYYIDLLMYNLKLHCYVVVELKAVEFMPEFVSKLNFYISAVDDTVKTADDKPTIGLLLCRTKSNKKAEYSLRGITQPMGIAEYETRRLFEDVASALPQIEDLENGLDDNDES